MAPSTDVSSPTEELSTRELSGDDLRLFRDPLCASLDALCASEIFRNSPRSCEFIRHVVGRTLDGNADELKERLIGMSLLGRDASYDTGTDAGVRVRAIPCDDYCIADGSIADAGFVHAILKIGAGRSEAAKQAVCTGLFEIMKSHFAEAFAKQGLALSLELHEFSEAGTLKHNNLHARLKRP